MNYTSLISEVSLQLAFYLDKLKVKSPLVFVGVQVLILGLLAAFTFNKVNINETVDAIVITVLLGLTSAISPRTSQGAQEVKDREEDTNTNPYPVFKDKLPN